MVGAAITAIENAHKRLEEGSNYILDATLIIKRAGG